MLACVVLAVVAFGYFHWSTRASVRRWERYSAPAPPGPAEHHLKDVMLGAQPAEARFDALMNYMTDGFVRHSDANLSRVHYFGYGSWNGYATDGVEGFARTGIAVAAWIHHGRRSDSAPELLNRLTTGLLNGTNPQSAGYWGDLKSGGQLIVEAADIARIVWLTRERIWNQLTEAQQQRIALWLRAAALAGTPENNWMLMRVSISSVLLALHAIPATDAAVTQSREQFDDFKDFYLSNGWFFDRPEGVDFYNTWGITYELFWIHLVDPDFDAAFIQQAIQDSANLTEHLISPRGIPIMGRSVCYRTAVPVPVIAASLQEAPGTVTPGTALRALDVVWRYFIARDSLQDGALTQGYFAADPRLLDRYSGPASCQWGLRSLVLAFLHPSGDAFWRGPEEALPVERSDYQLDLPALRWVVAGHHDTGEITVTLPANNVGSSPLEPYTWYMKAKELWIGQPLRPINHAAKYENRVYSSATPFPAQP